MTENKADFIRFTLEAAGRTTREKYLNLLIYLNRVLIGFGTFCYLMFGFCEISYLNYLSFRMKYCTF